MDQPQHPALPLQHLQEMALELDNYRQILETASDAVVTINQDHEVVYMNRAAERLFGYRRQEILGGDLAPLIPKEHRARHRGYVQRYLRTRKPRLLGHSARLTAERRDGSRVPVSISFNLFQSGQGLFFTAILRDLSIEHDLAQRAKDAEDLASVGRMVATVNHEIKTPLTVIGGFARQLARAEGLSEKARRKLGIIVEEVERMESLLEDLSDLTRPRRYHWEELDLAALAGHLREVLTPRLQQKGVELEIQSSRPLPLVSADRNRFSQVLINLINNAVQASRPGSRVELDIHGDSQGGVVLEVRDQGCGIPTEQQDKIFTPFFTTKPHGTGLGLPVAKRIVEDHGGTIVVHSQPGRGTTVVIHLPPAHGGVPLPPPPPPPSSPQA